MKTTNLSFKKLQMRAALVILAMFLLQLNCQKLGENWDLKGPYLGQNPPGNEPQLFMPGLISTNYIDHCIGFLKNGKVCVFSIWEKGTYYMYEKDGRWTSPEETPWQNERGPTDFTAGPDGDTVYFQSRRPTAPDDTTQENNTWKVLWTGDGWTEPVPLPPPANTEEFSEIYPSVDSDGSVYFFTGSRPDSRIGDIYRSKRIGDTFLEAERLPNPINSDYYEVDPFVAPDGSYLLFGSSRPGGYSLLDLYISFREEDGGWTLPINTGPRLNPFCIPTRMSVTPDGKYFFFPSRHETVVSKGKDVSSSKVIRWGDYDVYWIDTSFIKNLKDQYKGKKSAAQKIMAEYQSKGIHAAAMMLTKIFSTGKQRYYFELSEFMSLCGDLMENGQYEDSEQLYKTLLKVLPERLIIKQGYAMTCIMNDVVAKGLNLLKEIWDEDSSHKPEDLYMIPFHLRRKSRKDDELAVLQFFVQAFPGSGLDHFNLAEAHEYYGNVREAVIQCKKVLTLIPDFQDAIEMEKRLAGRLK